MAVSGIVLSDSSAIDLPVAVSSRLRADGDQVFFLSYKGLGLVSHESSADYPQGPPGLDAPCINVLDCRPALEERFVEVPGKVLEKLQFASRQEVILDLRLSNPNPRGLVSRAYMRDSMRRGLLAYRLTKIFLTENTFEKIVVPNGRYSHQVGIACAAEELNCQVHFYDAPLNGVLGGCFYRDYTARDRAQIQSDARVACDPRPVSEILDFGKRWLNSRASLPQESQVRERGWSFFSSSVDEAVASSLVEGRTSLPDQFIALKSFLREASYSGDLVVRLHPNIVNKSFRSAAAQTLSALINFQGRDKTQIFLPSSRVDSYSLLRDSSRVVVGHSTVGMEAALLGIPVASLWPTDYSEICLIPRYRPGSGIAWSDTHRARLGASTYLYGNFLLDQASDVSQEQGMGAAAKSNPERWSGQRILVELNVFVRLFLDSWDNAARLPALYQRVNFWSNRLFFALIRRIYSNVH